MKTTFDLPNDLVREIKLRALDDGRKLKDAVVDLLQKGLAVPVEPLAPAARPVIKTDPKTGLPYIKCAPDAPARRMSTAQLIAQEHHTQTEEDLERVGITHR